MSAKRQPEEEPFRRCVPPILMKVVVDAIPVALPKLVGPYLSERQDRQRSSRVVMAIQCQIEMEVERGPLDEESISRMRPANECPPENSGM